MGRARVATLHKDMSKKVQNRVQNREKYELTSKGIE